jgi:hypothetical protein
MAKNELEERLEYLEAWTQVMAERMSLVDQNVHVHLVRARIADNKKLANRKQKKF